MVLQKLLLLPWKTSASPELLEPVKPCWNIRPRTSDAKTILRAFCRGKTSLPNLPSKSSRVTVPSTYSHQCFPSVETGISQLDHLQARWIQTQATTGGVYCRLKVVRCRLTSPGEKTKSHQLPRLSCRSTRDMGGNVGVALWTSPERPSGTASSIPLQHSGAPGPLRLFGPGLLQGIWVLLHQFLFSFYTGNLGASLRGGKPLGTCQPHLCSEEKLIPALLQEIWDLLHHLVHPYCATGNLGPPPPKEENQC